MTKQELLIKMKEVELEVLKATDKLETQLFDLNSDLECANYDE